MIDPTPNEIAAMEAAAAEAGKYIDSLGKTDMAAFTYAEWMGLNEVIITGYVDAMGRLTGMDRKRIATMTEEMPF